MTVAGAVSRRFAVHNGLAVLFLLLIYSPLVVAEDVNYKIGNLRNVTLTQWTGSGDRSDAFDVCVYSDDPVYDTYSVTASTPSVSGNKYELVRGQAPVTRLPFKIEFKGSAGETGTYTELPINTAKNFDGAYHEDENCDLWTEVNGNIRLTVLEDDLAAATEGTYGCTVTIVVGPATG